MRFLLELINYCFVKSRLILTWLILFLVSPFFILPSYAQRSIISQRPTINSRSIQIPISTPTSINVPEPLNVNEVDNFTAQPTKRIVENKISLDELDSVEVKIEDKSLNTNDNLLTNETEEDIEVVVEPVTEFIFGDANLDGEVNVLDIVLVRNHILGRTTLTGAAYSRTAFVAADFSSIDVSDLVIMENYIIGEIDEIEGPFAQLNTEAELLAQEKNFMEVYEKDVELYETLADVYSVEVESRATNAYGFGDANNDGFVNILDIVQVRNHILGRETLTGTGFFNAALAAEHYDAVDVVDIVQMVNFILGRVDSIDGPLKKANSEDELIEQENFLLDLFVNNFEYYQALEDLILDNMAYRSFSGFGFGDANADGFINVLDVVLVRNHILGRITLTGGDYSRTAFVAPDFSTIDISDVVIMRDFILENIDEILGPFATIPTSSSVSDEVVVEEASDKCFDGELEVSCDTQSSLKEAVVDVDGQQSTKTKTDDPVYLYSGVEQFFEFIPVDEDDSELER